LNEDAANLPHRFGAVVLAAGASRRMGRPKALLDLGGRPLVSHLIDTLTRTIPAAKLIVVTGHQPELIRQSLAGFDLTLIHNLGYDSGGMLSSVRTGVNAVAKKCDAFFLALLDQPLVKAPTIAAMAQTWSKSQPDVVVPSCSGKRGHPILIASRCEKKIVSLSPDSTLRDFVAQHRHNTEVLELNDPGVLTSLDTPADYQIVLNHWRTLTCPTVPAEPA
jgi:molybdenum cofactor cytidylyltransferase